jgi:membrane protease YdiL (CAAX protease family)
MVSRTSSIRNLAIFAVAALTSGWIGHWLDGVIGVPHGEGAGQLLWIAGPLLTALILRGFAGDGWGDFGLRPALARNAPWYLFSLAFFPFCTAAVVLAGMAFGRVSVPGFSASGSVMFLHLVSLALIPSFVKNLFEEFAWRGYLVPRITAVGMADLAGHLLVGPVWAAWHIPYYLFFLDRATLEAYTPLGMPLFILMMFPGVAALSIVYGELRLLTGSVWPAVLLHTVSNAVADPLFLHGYLRVSPEADILFSPGPGSVVSIVLSCCIGFGLYRFRTRRMAHSIF